MHCTSGNYGTGEAEMSSFKIGENGVGPFFSLKKGF
jgi:hypothetical protein